MAISITIRYTKEEEIAGLHSYGLRVEALAATDMTDKIFVIRRGVPSASDNEVDEPNELDEFRNIASPVEIEQIPGDAPTSTPTNVNPYYRVNSIVLAFRSYSELVETLAMIKGDITNLVRALKHEAILSVEEDVTYD